jgi:hypothetical protein
MNRAKFRVMQKEVGDEMFKRPIPVELLEHYFRVVTNFWARRRERRERSDA